MNYLISIVIPVYNCEPYLDELLNSILRQEYKNYEVLLINDGSTDNSEIICLKYTSIDKRIKYFYKNNTGVSDTRNFGIEKAIGKFICFVDADDMISPTYLSDFIKLVDIKENELYCCDLKKQLNPMIIDDKKEVKLIEFEDINKYYIINSNAGGYMCNKMFITDIIKDKGIKFNKDIYMCEDFLFVFEYLEYCNRVKYIEKSNYIYRIIPTSASKKLKNVKWFSILNVYDEILDKNYLYSIDFFNKIYYSYVIYLYQAKYRLNFIKDDYNYNSIKKDINKRIKSINEKNKGCFTIKERIKLFFYKYFNRISFYLKLKKDMNVKKEE